MNKEIHGFAEAAIDSVDGEGCCCAKDDAYSNGEEKTGSSKMSCPCCDTIEGLQSNDILSGRALLALPDLKLDAVAF
jgi:hypothetical protein